MKAILFTSVLLLCASCGTEAEYVSVSSISESWLEAKKAIIASLQNPSSFQPAQQNPTENLDEFIENINLFQISPLGNLYQFYHLEEMTISEMHFFENLTAAAEQLNIALQNQNETDIFPLIIEIDESIVLLQNIDTNISDTSQMNYFYLFFFFAVLILMIIAAMSFLYKKLASSEERERRSVTFSRETIMAQEEERSRIARELHDTVAQDLWRITFQTDNIGRTENTEERNRLCKETVNEQRELMKRIRSICDTLIPPDFSRRKLVDSLRTLCYNFEQRTGIMCKVLIEEPINFGELESGEQLQCFRIVQECFANIEKHAEAAEVSVSVRNKNDDTLEVLVTDNGKGFSPPNRGSRNLDSLGKFKDGGHYGLWSMFERAALLDGKLIIDSEIGKGTIVHFSLPIFPQKMMEQG
jgi:signal transduction histidine kinase